MTNELRIQFLLLRSQFYNKEITRQQYIDRYFGLGKANNIILYYPIVK